MNVCPAKDRKKPDRKAINMTPIETVLEREKEKFDFFTDLPEPDTSEMKLDVKTSQLRQPLFEYSGACAGCGETPYIKLLTQLMGDRLLVANATGCSSIYGGNLPTTPYAVDSHGRGPAWSNSLFEDNAEFGFGMRMAIDFKTNLARTLLAPLASTLGDDWTTALLNDPQDGEAALRAQRERVEALKEKLSGIDKPEARALLPLADYLVRKSVWCIGGDGWAYDIGFGGLDHVLASGANINVLVLDTEVYSNTGGQSSKSTPMGAVAKFAAGGKARGKKDLGLIAMGYGHVYVATVAMGAKDSQTLNALTEADSYDGPSLVIAYTHCVGHGYDLAHGLDQQKLAVDTGYWPIYRFDPRRASETESPLKLDSGPPKRPLRDYMNNELRFRILQNSAPERADQLYQEAQAAVESRYKHYKSLATVESEEKS